MDLRWAGRRKTVVSRHGYVDRLCTCTVDVQAMSNHKPPPNRCLRVLILTPDVFYTCTGKHLWVGGLATST